MKATLSFKLPEDSVEHLTALHGAEWKRVVWDMADQLRNYRKHGHHFQDADACIEELETLLRSMIEERSLYLE